MTENPKKKIDTWEIRTLASEDNSFSSELAGCRLNHSAKVSDEWKNCDTVTNILNIQSAIGKDQSLGHLRHLSPSGAKLPAGKSIQLQR